MIKMTVNENNIKMAIIILNDAIEEKEFDIHLGKVSNINQIPETFFTNIPYNILRAYYVAEKIRVKIPPNVIYESIIDLDTRGDRYRIYRNKSIITITDTGDIYLLESDNIAYEFKLKVS